MVAVLAFLKQLETSKVMGKHQTNIPGTMFLFFGVATWSTRKCTCTTCMYACHVYTCPVIYCNKHLHIVISNANYDLWLSILEPHGISRRRLSSASDNNSVHLGLVRYIVAVSLVDVFPKAWIKLKCPLSSTISCIHGWIWIDFLPTLW